MIFLILSIVPFGTIKHCRLAVPSADVLIVSVFVCCRPGSTIVDLGVDFTTNVNESFVRAVTPTILQNLMDTGNTFTINGTNYDAGVEMLFEREVPRMNGSRIVADNITACTSTAWLLVLFISTVLSSEYPVYSLLLF